MLIVHHLGVSQSERIVWLCEELGLPYELRHYERDPATRLAPPAYQALHPMGIAPIITDGPLVLAESGAIVEYLMARYGGGRLAVKSDSPNFADYLFWLHFANGTVMPSDMTRLVVGMLGGSDHVIAKALTSRSERALALVETQLGKATYFAGDELTAADIMMVFPLTTMRAFAPRDMTPFPNIRRYLKTIGERPAYQRAMAKGDPGMTPVLN